MAIKSNELNSRAINHLKEMMFVRAVEDHVARMRELGHIKGPVHLGVGQEAIAVGVSTHLRKTDRVFGAHRSHLHLLALGTDLRKFFAELLGKATGLSKGMGGSMHLIDKSVGFYGSVPIVAGTVPLAVGAALAARLQNTNDIAVSYFGDGAMEEGIVHESLNSAKMLDTPVLFVVENNFFASHMNVTERQPDQNMSRFAVANHLVYRSVDGNDVQAVDEASAELIALARREKVPVLLEAFTYRHYGHVDWRMDIDVGVGRTEEDLDIWRAKDPILNLRQKLIDNKLWCSVDEEKIVYHSKSLIEACWKQAELDPYPEDQSISKWTYSE